jgi:hypothetical protein
MGSVIPQPAQRFLGISTHARRASLLNKVQDTSQGQSLHAESKIPTIKRSREQPLECPGNHFMEQNSLFLMENAADMETRVSRKLLGRLKSLIRNFHARPEYNITPPIRYKMQKVPQTFEVYHIKLPQQQNSYTNSPSFLWNIKHQ